MDYKRMNEFRLLGLTIAHRRGHIVVNPDLTVTCDTHSTWKFNA